MKLKVVFIEPPHVYLIQQKTQAPLGLMYLSAVLEKEGYDVQIARLESTNRIDWLKKIPQGDIYGLSAVSLDYGTCKDIACVLRKHRKNKPIIIGGYHVTADLDTVLKNDRWLWDAICAGEGEGIITTILHDFEKNKLQKVYRGLLQPNLDTLPLPARHLIAEQGGNIFAYDKHYTQNKLSTVISSSRGCPFTCSFCGTQAMWQRKIRFRSAENIYNEVKHCIDIYNIRQFRFSDEAFSANRERTVKLLKYFKGLDIHWKCSTRVDCVDLELLKLMKEGGCEEIAFGIESADENVLPYLNKKINLKITKDALRMCNAIGMNTRLLLMIGTPGERIDTVDKNIDFLESIPYTCASLAVFKPLPGSDVWKNPEKYKVKILSCDLREYNIYMWARGRLKENKNEHIIRILTLPSVKYQIRNRRRMISYFMHNDRMNEIKKAKKQISFWIHGIPKEENLYIGKNETPLTQRKFIYRGLWEYISQFVTDNMSYSLEIGCGRGTISQYFKKEKRLITFLCDIESELVNLAKRNFEKIKEKAHILLIDKKHLPLKDNTFDLIVSMGFLEHCQGINSYLARIKDLLRPGGIFICYNAPDRWSIQKAVNLIFHRIDYQRSNLKLSDYKRILVDQGFKIIEAAHINPYPVINTVPEKYEYIIARVYGYIGRIRNVFLKHHIKTNRFFAIGHIIIARKP